MKQKDKLSESPAELIPPSKSYERKFYAVRCEGHVLPGYLRRLQEYGFKIAGVHPNKVGDDFVVIAWTLEEAS